MNLEKRVIISTRPETESDVIKDYLVKKGVTYINMPLTEIVRAELTTEIENVLLKVKTFDWIVFTSKNGVNHFLDIYKDTKNRKFQSKKIKLATFGSKTTSALTDAGYIPNVEATEKTSELFLDNFLKLIKPKDKILLTLGDLAADTLEVGLKNYCTVERINVYKTINNINSYPDIIKRIVRDEYDLIIFTSPSGFRSFLERIGEESVIDLNIACIGETTAKEVRKYGFKPSVVGSQPDGKTFAKEIEDYLINKL